MMVLVMHHIKLELELKASKLPEPSPMPCACKHPASEKVLATCWLSALSFSCPRKNISIIARALTVSFEYLTS